jgi:hypothetical protein
MSPAFNHNRDRGSGNGDRGTGAGPQPLIPASWPQIPTPMRVLIVEDDPELAGLVPDRLRAQRIEPEMAARR